MVPDEQPLSFANRDAGAEPSVGDEVLAIDFREPFQPLRIYKPQFFMGDIE